VTVIDRRNRDQFQPLLYQVATTGLLAPEIARLKRSGGMAWLAWLRMHLLSLIGFRNKLAVLMQWTYSYCTCRRGARIITSPGAGSKSDD
jgi:NADH dehydrogenase FAD-containing subunit